MGIQRDVEGLRTLTPIMVKQKRTRNMKWILRVYCRLRPACEGPDCASLICSGFDEFQSTATEAPFSDTIITLPPKSFRKCLLGESGDLVSR